MKSRMLLPCGVDQPLAPHGHGDAVGAGELQRLGHQVVVGVLAGADDQPAGRTCACRSVSAVLRLCMRPVDPLHRTSSSAHQRHDFHAIPVAQHVLGVPAPRHQFQIDLDGHVGAAAAPTRASSAATVVPSARPAVGR